MKELMRLSLLLMFSILLINFLSMGCTNPNPINATNITDNVTNASNQSLSLTVVPIGSKENILYLIYDPRLPASTIQELKDPMNNVAEMLGIDSETRCADYDLIASGRPSDASNMCREQNEAEYNDTIRFLQDNSVTSVFFTYHNGEAISITYSPVSLKFAHNLCDAMVENPVDLCNSLPDVPVVDAVIIDNTSFDSTLFLSQMNDYGLPLSIEPVEDISSAIEEYGLDYIPAIVILADTVTDADQSDLLETMAMSGGIIKHGNNYIIYPVSDNQLFVGPKHDVVDMEVYVVSYCPYGVQMEKGVLPVKDLLGDKLNLTIKFIPAMHGQKEADENLRQYCIQKEQNDKFWDYLTCFADSNDPTECMASSGVNTSMVDLCIENTDMQTVTRDAVEKGIGSSPTTYLEGKKYDRMPRTPEQIKNVICEILNDPEGLCDINLSTGASAPSGSCG